MTKIIKSADQKMREVLDRAAIEGKISYECTDLINELVQDTEFYPLDTECFVYKSKHKETGFDIYADYLLAEDVENDKGKEYSATRPGETMEKMTLWQALCLFIKQNDLLDRTELAIKLCAARNIAGLTQKALAHKLGKVPQEIQRWESGAFAPALPNLKKLAEACNIDLKYLV